MCLTVRSIPQVWQMGGSSLAIKKPWVILVCPMWILLSRYCRVPFLLFVWGWGCTIDLSLLISLSLVFCLFQISSHFTSNIFLIQEPTYFFVVVENMFYLGNIRIIYKLKLIRLVCQLLHCLLFQCPGIQKYCYSFKLFWNLDVMLDQNLETRNELVLNIFVVLNESLRILYFGWSSWIMSSIALKIAIALAVYLEQLGDNLWINLLLVLL